jgi:hypothetical protein
LVGEAAGRAKGDEADAAGGTVDMGPQQRADGPRRGSKEGEKARMDLLFDRCLFGLSKLT